jgi:hypothetical protein
MGPLSRRAAAKSLIWKRLPKLAQRLLCVEGVRLTASKSASADAIRR